MVNKASMALIIGVDLAFDPKSPLEFEHFDKKYLGRHTAQCPYQPNNCSGARPRLIRILLASARGLVNSSEQLYTTE